MSIYINPGNEGFRTVRNSEYVDKSGMIEVINGTINTKSKLSCISRPRRFGKSTAAQMLCAYYDRTVDSSELFDDLEIAGKPSYKEHLNKYNVLYLDITSFIGETDAEGLMSFIRERIIKDVSRDMPECACEGSVIETLAGIVQATGRKFVAIIDEWDAVIRDDKFTDEERKDFLQFLRTLFKNSSATDRVFAAAYMTGILPIKKDGTQSAISEFIEYTMLDSGEFAKYVGFTENEVKNLCEKYAVDFDTMKSWYDGYSLKGVDSVYNPNSVMRAIYNKAFQSYWQMTSAADSLLGWLNYDNYGPGEVVPDLLMGKSVPVSVRQFKNDLVSFKSKDDVLTLLIHFGYLSYDTETELVRIPNEEIRNEFSDIMKDINNAETTKRVNESIDLIKNTIAMNEVAVAKAIESVHMEESDPKHYNNEQALRSIVKMAYFAYKDYYLKLEELAGGTGYADIVYLPKKKRNIPALVVELKYNDSADNAINQIKSRNYPAVLKGCEEDILLVGISYNKDDPQKKHSCRIEKVEKKLE